MSYKMIVLDLDDTLLRDDHTISDRTKDALMRAQEKGVKVVLASGRPTSAMKHIAEELELAKYGSFILSFNGSQIIDWQDKQRVFSKTLSPEAVHKLYDISRREGVSIHTYIGDDIVTEDDSMYTAEESAITGIPVKFVDSFKKAVTEPVVKCLMLHDPEILKVVEAKLQAELEEEFSVMRSKPYFLEFMQKGITKGTSLNHLIQILGIEREEVIAMGDSYNDLEMIRFAGLGVAMGNANDDIKAAADYVTDTNMNDGVAKVVEEFILNELVTA